MNAKLMAMVAFAAFAVAVRAGDAVIAANAKIANEPPISDATNAIISKMKKIVVPSVDLTPTMTLKDAVEFLRMASKEHDPNKAGVNIVLKTAEGEPVPVVPRIRTNKISVYEALELVLGAVGYDFEAKGDGVAVFKKGSAAKK